MSAMPLSFLLFANLTVKYPISIVGFFFWLGLFLVGFWDIFFQVKNKANDSTYLSIPP